MLVSVQQMAARSSLLDPTANAVQQWLKLNPNVEVFLLDTRLQTPAVEIIGKGREEEEHIDALFKPHQGLCAVPYPWEQDFFIDAKRPNEQDAIPLGGPY